MNPSTIVPGQIWRRLRATKLVDRTVIAVANTTDPTREPVIISVDSVGALHTAPLARWQQEWVRLGDECIEQLGLTPVHGLLPVAVVEIIRERWRQKHEEGNSDDIDDSHGPHVLMGAALNYLYSAMLWRAGGNPAAEPPPFVDAWPKLADGSPWSFKPKNVKRDLVRAAALLLAEAERMDRAERKGKLVGLAAQNDPAPAEPAATENTP